MDFKVASNFFYYQLVLQHVSMYMYECVHKLFLHLYNYIFKTSPWREVTDSKSVYI
jgi:hypothetical protein